MPKDVTVRALKAFTYRHRDVRRNDAVTMTPLDAAVHARRGDVSLAAGYRTRDVTPELPEPEPEPRRTRRYRRRDLVAEDQQDA
jgi:hypothetical protein